MTKKIFNFYSLILVTLFTIGCGYKLDNSLFDNTNIAINIEPKIGELNRLLEESLINKFPKGEDRKDIFFIKINKHDISKYSASLTSGSQIENVRIEYLLAFTIRTPTGKILSRDFREDKYLNYNQSEVLAMDSEEDKLKRQFINNSSDYIEFVLKKIAYEN